jgi:hypothetical protein
MRRHFHHRGACHDAVGIKHDHILIKPAPAPAKLGDIARLAAGVFGAVAVEHMQVSRQVDRHPRPSPLLFEPHMRIRCVAEHKQTESTGAARFLQRLRDGLQVREDLEGIFVVNGHDNRRRGKLRPIRWRMLLLTVAA